MCPNVQNDAHILVFHETDLFDRYDFLRLAASVMARRLGCGEEEGLEDPPMHLLTSLSMSLPVNNENRCFKLHLSTQKQTQSVATAIKHD